MATQGRNPPGVYLLSATEMWERFSYYALAGLLALFLSAPIADGGFGWRPEQAVQLFGLVSGLAFATPAIGGWLVSRWIGEQTAILAGGIAIAFGQIALAFVAARGPGADGSIPLFWTALAAIVGGTALLKPAVSAAVGLLYAPRDARRGSGYAIFMTGVWAGSFLSNLIAGSIGEWFGWHWGFLTAGAGMAFGTLLFVGFRGRWLVELRPPAATNAEPAQAKPPLTRDQRTALGGLALISLFTVAYATLFYQKGGFLNLLVKGDVDRMIGAFTVPATWFLSISTGVFILATPVFAALWNHRIARGGTAPDVCISLVIGLALLAGGYAMFAAGYAFSDGAAVPMLWFVAGYIFFGLADIFIWPPQIALASTLAPPHLASFVIGLWYVSIGVGSYASGLVGASLVGSPPLYALVGLGATIGIFSLAALAARPALLSRINQGSDRP
ncbi:MAG: MFS transporter [Sphingomonadales bacterium]|nr:MFS transporter [Sphingomonadales bacterium]